MNASLGHNLHKAYWPSRMPQAYLKGTVARRIWTSHQRVRTFLEEDYKPRTIINLGQHYSYNILTADTDTLKKELYQYEKIKFCSFCAFYLLHSSFPKCVNPPLTICHSVVFITSEATFLPNLFSQCKFSGVAYSAIREPIYIWYIQLKYIEYISSSRKAKYIEHRKYSYL